MDSNLRNTLHTIQMSFELNNIWLITIKTYKHFALHLDNNYLHIEYIFNH